MVGTSPLYRLPFTHSLLTSPSPSPPLPGGSPVIASQTHKFVGIRNGIDPELWDPENNQWLPLPYSSNNVVEGKAAARKVWRPYGVPCCSPV